MSIAVDQTRLRRITLRIAPGVSPTRAEGETILQIVQLAAGADEESHPQEHMVLQQIAQHIGSMVGLELDELHMIPKVPDEEARAAGFTDRGELARDIAKYARAYPDNDLYRIEFRFLAVEDPRSTLAQSEALSEEEVAAIFARLQQMDRRSTHGAWTQETLRIIAKHPARRAGDLADDLPD